MRATSPQGCDLRNVASTLRWLWLAVAVAVAVAVAAVAVGFELAHIGVREAPGSTYRPMFSQLRSYVAERR